MNDNNCANKSGCFNDGIKCSVKNCTHHSGEDHCNMNTVKIGKSNAMCEAETVCSSFESRI